MSCRENGHEGFGHAALDVDFEVLQGGLPHG
eukprot:CAMPEP_0179049924 /NCGR_PEP_ID=MMETSP0796-20121207/20464_1 /TAXON_ID=73915 /ORGANISM="Pyrodinium bahamense, Strain pbaha01" /LENGTH=30 /DNA_ID= /DNA_START= /DNA_END= /DNA_ORIENTATION=